VDPGKAGGSPRIDARDRCVAPQRRSLNRVAIAVLCACLGTGPLAETEVKAAAESQTSVNYAIGYALGRHLSGITDRGIGIEPQALLQGALDALSGAAPRVGEEAIRDELARLQGTVAGSQSDAEGASAPPEPPARTRGYRDDFAALNAKRPGVVTLPSGLQYEVLAAGKGRKPEADDWVRIRYEGRLTTGVVFDTTLDESEPLRVRVADIVVPGLREVLLAMREGDKWHAVIPPRLGFGAVGNNMLRKRDLIYDIELVAVEPSEQGQAPAQTGAVE
jgi:FKBP-type peptidyl-prolyl cis-trans isomerase FklB